MVYLIFENLNSAQSAADKIYANMVLCINSENLLNVNTMQIVDKDSLSIQQAIERDSNDRFFPVFGVIASNGNKNSINGFTTSWAQPQETKQGKFVFKKPDDVLMAGVSDYVIAPFDPNWFNDVA